MTKTESHEFIDDKGIAWGEFKTFRTLNGWYWQAMIAGVPLSGPFKSRAAAVADAQANRRFLDA